MRKLRPILLFAAVLALMAALALSASAVTLYVDEDGSMAYPPKEITPVPIVCGGQTLESDIPAYIESGRTMVPVRLIAETLGAQVDWLGATRQVRITLSGREIVLTIGSAEALVDGERMELYNGVPAVIAFDGAVKRTMVPLRFVAEMLGARAEFDSEARCVVVTLAGSETSRVTSLVAADDTLTLTCVGTYTPSVFQLSSPDRIVIDFPGGVLDGGIAYRNPVDGAAIAAVRANQYDRGYEGYEKVARVVVDLAEGAAFSDLVVDTSVPGVVTVMPADARPPEEPEEPEEEQPEDAEEPEQTPEEPQAPLVVLDAGHGGTDPGTQVEGLDEKDLNLEVETQVAALLEAAGVRVARTRTEDVYVTLADRAAMANELGADVFVSIHTNASSTSTEFRGVETYYLAGRDDCRALAAALHASVLEATDAVDHSVRVGGYYVLRNTEMPAALVEMGYVTNEDDLALLRSEAYRTGIARGIADGILTWLRAQGLLQAENA